MRPGPPRPADALLRVVLPPDDAEAISGDLEELFHQACARHGRRAAARAHWRQVVSIAWAYTVNRGRDRIGPQERRGGMAALRQDFSYAVRSLRKQPGFAATVVLMLALGIGANVAIFSLIHAVLLKPLPFSDPERLMLVHMLAPERDAPGVFRPTVWSYPKYDLFRQHQRVFESTALFTPGTWNVTGSGTPERIAGEFVEFTYFGVLGVQPQTGRAFTAEETRAPGSAPLAILSHGFWTRRFAADPSVVGRSVGLNGTPHTIAGVLPAGFRGLSGQADVWVPLMTLPADELGQPWSHSYSLVARRKPEATIEQTRAAMPVIAGVIAGEYKNQFPGGDWGLSAVPLQDERVDPLVRRSMLIMLGAVGALLLIVCINLANLMLARTLGRQREVGIRLALGASRFRIVRQLMTESLLLAALGAAASLFVAYTLISAGAAMMPNLQTVLPGSRSTLGLTRVGLDLLGLDAAVLLYAFAIAGMTAALFGLGPAWRAARRDLTSSIKIGSSGSLSQGTGGLRLRSALATSEMALALVLLTAGGLMIKSVARLQATELGFEPSRVLTVRLSLPAPQYDVPRATQLLADLLTRLSARPEIESVAYGHCAPLSDACNTTLATFPDRPPVPRGTEPEVGVRWASPAYLETLGIRLVRGRTFTERDRVGQPKVVIVNETAARAFWRGEDPIGKRIGVGQGGFRDGAEVIGVAADIRYGTVDEPVSPDVYLPLLQSGRSSGLLFIRSRATTATVVPLVRKELQTLDPDLPLVEIKMMQERLGDATWRTRMSAWLLGLFAALGLLLAAIGVYGVMSQGVEQRRREIGVRLALGAARGDIFRLIIGRVVAIAATGIVLGVLLAIPSARALTALLYQVRPGDPAVISGLALILLAVALAAGYLPARRATRVDPLTTLRAE